MNKIIEGNNISSSDVNKLNSILDGCIKPVLTEVDLHGYESGLNIEELLGDKLKIYINSLRELLIGCGYRETDIKSGMLDQIGPFVGIKESPDSTQLTTDDIGCESQETFWAMQSREIPIEINERKLKKMIQLINMLVDRINYKRTEIDIGNTKCDCEIMKFNPLEVEFCLVDLENLYNDGNNYIKKRCENKNNKYIVDGDFMKCFNRDNVQGWKSPSSQEIGEILERLYLLYPSVLGGESRHEDTIAFFMLLTHITGNIILSDGSILNCTSTNRGFVDSNKRNFGEVLLVRTPPSVKYSRQIVNALL